MRLVLALGVLPVLTLAIWDVQAAAGNLLKGGLTRLGMNDSAVERVFAVPVRDPAPFVGACAARQAALTPRSGSDRRQLGARPPHGRGEPAVDERAARRHGVGHFRVRARCVSSAPPLRVTDGAACPR